MKRMLAFLLAAALVVSEGAAAYAGQVGGAAPGSGIGAGVMGTISGTDVTGTVSGDDAASDSTLQQRVAAGQIGQVDVSIGAAVILNSPVEFTVKLTDSRNESQTRTAVLEANSDRETRVSFEGLSAGQYTVTVSAKGFAAYTQTISVDGRACGIRLLTGFVSGFSYAAGEYHPGVLLMGDVNGDGKLDAADRAALVDAIAGGPAVDAGDLNGDGVVDLADLEYFTRGYEVPAGADTQAVVDRFVPVTLIEPSAGSGTQAEGNLKELLKGTGSVTLTPEGGGAISSNSPVSLAFDFAAAGGAVVTDGILIGTSRENPVSDSVITITYTDANGVEQTDTIPVREGVYPLLENSARAETDRNGNIRLYLGAQVAVKKVTFTILGMTNNNNLAEISKVEFVNGMEERIPEPEMDIPENLKPVAGSKRISLSWDPCNNITGYEVLIRQGDRQETVLVNGNAFDVSSFQGRELANYTEYQIQVQSVNGTWRSGYCSAVSATPTPTGKPDKPDGVSAAGRYRSVAVSWKAMKDTLTYNLYYKESSAGEYQKIGEIKENSYVIEGLKDLTEYTVYVTAVNEFGESAPSLSAAAKTTDTDPAVMPKYNLINVGEKGEKSAHIISAQMWGSMQDSPLDTEAGTAWGTVDHDASSYYLKSSWDDGGYNPVGSPLNQSNGLLYEFDQVYKIDTIAFHDLTSQDSGYSYAKARYWDENGNATNLTGLSLQQKRDSDGRLYYVLKLSEPVNAKKFQFGLARYSAAGSITISEVYFYYYDTLMDEIMGLYADDLHTVLRDDVTQAVIDALRVKINTIDPVSGEYHPDRQLLELELQTAEAILNDIGLNPSVRIHNEITTNDAGRGFGGLNAWQPLGISAAAQEEIMVYVGHSTKKTGDATDLELIATQYHSESGGVSTVAAQLKVGPNKITVPKIGSTTGVESGGALYIQNKGNGLNGQYAVRVSGGQQVPALDLYQVTDDAERLARAKKYVEELEAHVSGMAASHSQVHENGGNSQVNYAYDSQNCILGASDILLDTMMLSLPAEQLLAGAGSGSVEQKAQTILNAMKSMEDMMYLFYQHKGLNNSAAEALNQVPKGHLNIRYQRMFSGAFMYAAGNHIGIEWGSARLTGASSVVTDSNGKWVSGSYFGWGIAHEIGHCINQGAYAIAEITNNYFAVLAQARDNNDSVRFKYEEVYKKVTSGAKGMASNVFTQLGMYWQLHLAYDSGYNYKTYADYNEQLANLFFARVDTYARDTKKAPAPGGVALTLSGDRDQDLMRLSCAAAQKNILEFFERWGMTPNEDTKKYAAQFQPETRAIYYVCDDSRVYTLEKGTGSVLGTDGNVEAVGTVTAQVSSQNPNQIDFTLSAQGISQEEVLGYEIVRCTRSGGRVERQPVGFTTSNTFSDRVYMNNRVVWYEITLIDQYLNRSKIKETAPIKIGDDGSLDKSFWTVGVLGLTAVAQNPGQGTEELPCEPTPEDPAIKLLDNDPATVYTAAADDNAEIVVEFNRNYTVSGFRYTAVAGIPGDSYEVQVRSGGVWFKAAEGSFGQGASDSGTVHFFNSAGDYVTAYEADALKLILKAAGGKQVSIGELDVLGVTGDNVEFDYTDDNKPVIGTLGEAFQYGQSTDDVIPAGSVVFTGTFKGNSAYNVVILYDQAGNIVGGTDAAGSLKAQQILLQNVPVEGDIPNVYQGTWIYWIEPGQQVDLTALEMVRAELYRVDNAQTNQGQRLVSDSLFAEVPEGLPQITLGGQ